MYKNQKQATIKPAFVIKQHELLFALSNTLRNNLFYARYLSIIIVLKRKEPSFFQHLFPWNCAFGFRLDSTIIFSQLVIE